MFLFIPPHFSKGPSLMILSNSNKDRHMCKTSIYYFKKLINAVKKYLRVLIQNKREDQYQ